MYELNPYRTPDDEGTTAAGPPEFANSNEEFNALLETLTPHVFVAFILIGLNVIVFLAMIVSNVDIMQPTPDALLRWGANYGPLTLTGGQWWRLFTSMFLHIGLIHIAFNMFVLFQAGPFVERLLGNAAFLVVYLVSGLAGALVSLAWNPNVVSAGASGAIFGVYGVLLGYLLLVKDDAIPAERVGALTKSALIFIGYNVVFGVLNKGTDLAAHGGGLVAGFLCGLVLSAPLLDEHRRSRSIRTAAIAIVTVALGAAAYFALPRPPDLRAEVLKFFALEKRTMAAFSADLKRLRTEHLSSPQLADLVEKNVLPDWVKERDTLEHFTRLPAKQKQLVAELVEYMEMREQGWSMLVRGLRKNDLITMRKAMLKEREAQVFVQTAMAKNKGVL